MTKINGYNKKKIWISIKKISNKSNYNLLLISIKKIMVDNLNNFIIVILNFKIKLYKLFFFK